MSRLQTIWGAIPGHNGYIVSIDGDVRSLDRDINFMRGGNKITRFQRGGLLSTRLRMGYPSVTMVKALIYTE